MSTLHIVVVGLVIVGDAALWVFAVYLYRHIRIRAAKGYQPKANGPRPAPPSGGSDATPPPMCARCRSPDHHVSDCPHPFV